MDHSLATLLAQKNEEDFEQAIYFLNRTLIGAECHYNPVEKECLSGLCHTKDTILLDWANYSCYFKSHSPSDSGDKA